MNWKPYIKWLPSPIRTAQQIRRGILQALPIAISEIQRRNKGWQPSPHLLGTMRNSLLWNRYSFRALKAQWIESPKGNARKLSIPNLTDRIMSLAILIGIGRHRLSKERLVNQGMHTSSWCLPQKGTHKAWQWIRRQEGGWIVALDIKGYFDNIPQDILIEALNKSMNKTNKEEREMLKTLIIREVKDVKPEEWAERLLTLKGKSIPTLKTHTTGCPQGDPMSPYLSNMNGTLIDMYIEKKLKKHFTRYIDDVNILTPSLRSAKKTVTSMQRYLSEIGLELSTAKTHLTCGGLKPTTIGTEQYDSYQTRILGLIPIYTKGQWRGLIPEETGQRIIERLKEPTTTISRMNGILNYWTRGGVSTFNAQLAKLMITWYSSEKKDQSLLFQLRNIAQTQEPIDKWDVYAHYRYLVERKSWEIDDRAQVQQAVKTAGIEIDTNPQRWTLNSMTSPQRSVETRRVITKQGLLREELR